jgi:hypothetical protein
MYLAVVMRSAQEVLSNQKKAVKREELARSASLVCSFHSIGSLVADIAQQRQQQQQQHQQQQQQQQEKKQKVAKKLKGRWTVLRLKVASIGGHKRTGSGPDSSAASSATDPRASGDDASCSSTSSSSSSVPLSASSEVDVLSWGKLSHEVESWDSLQKVRFRAGCSDPLLSAPQSANPHSKSAPLLVRVPNYHYEFGKVRARASTRLDLVEAPLG